MTDWIKKKNLFLCWHFYHLLGINPKIFIINIFIIINIIKDYLCNYILRFSSNYGFMTSNKGKPLMLIALNNVTKTLIKKISVNEMKHWNEIIYFIDFIEHIWFIYKHICLIVFLRFKKYLKDKKIILDVFESCLTFLDKG